MVLAPPRSAAGEDAMSCLASEFFLFCIGMLIGSALGGDSNR